MTDRAYMLRPKTTEYETPPDLFDQLNEEFGPFTFDPCGQVEHRTVFRVLDNGGRFYDGSSEEFDGLMQPWEGKVFMNPPYGKGIAEWVEKAYLEVRHWRAKMVVALLPVRTDTKWWQSWVMSAAHKELPPAREIEGPYELNEVRFLPGRLKFSGEKNSAPFPSAIVVWRRYP